MSSLESIAEEVRMRAYRLFAADHDITLAELLAEIEGEQSIVNRLKAEGLSLDAIMVRCAEAWGMTLDEVRAECEDIERRYFGRISKRG